MILKRCFLGFSRVIVILQFSRVSSMFFVLFFSKRNKLCEIKPWQETYQMVFIHTSKHQVDPRAPTTFWVSVVLGGFGGFSTPS